MRLDSPRIEPLPESEIPSEVRERLADGPVFNIFRTLARHPKLVKRWMVFGNHVLSKSSLPARDRELVILRIGWLCRSEYEFGQHTVIARRCGISDEEIERVCRGPNAEGWSDFDRVLLGAVDELHGDAFLSDETWTAVRERYGEEQVMDLIFAVGQYNLVSMALNSLGVQRDEGVPGFPESATV